ncbi:uncharacterized protein BP5553_08123 [Venustampulla echinocandica]|uniref:Uncharacterized protein n=1 Tax=Venustampulla echinocandica TaxID=2656787 RepID=A0A370TFT5_9HELO|nr:uncharacterized protein BP5553_08123 [Venustampulla echinocandica]RDL33755.1 hypothetical protein BP5553_08123 [Venustampulla echinocandica]
MSSFQPPEICRHGLTEVYQPQGGAETVQAVAHVVFVHGLFGHPRKTWTASLERSATLRLFLIVLSLRGSGNSTSKSTPQGRDGGSDQDRGGDNKVFWPAALLPQVIPDSRIHTWGYDADVDRLRSPVSLNTVPQYAANVLSDIADLIEIDGNNLPLIFVAHGLGGIVVKAAINQSFETRGTRLSIVAPAVRGVVFLGTPHRGSDSVSIPEIAYNITRGVGRNPNGKLLQALEKNSEILDRTHKSFLQKISGCPKLLVAAFREEMETRKLFFFSTFVVKPDSATLGIANEEESSIPTNHSDMTKFGSSSDVGFKRVSAQ